MSQLYNFLMGLNPMWLCVFIILMIWIFKKIYPHVRKMFYKIIEEKKKEFDDIKKGVESINVRLINLQEGISEIKENIESNNKYTKELFIDRIEERISYIKNRYKKTKEPPTQDEMTVLYKMWDRVEKLGDGFQEVKRDLDELRQLA